MGLSPAAASWSPYVAKTSGKNAVTTWPKMIGSETFIIVALRCTEKSTPFRLRPGDGVGDEGVEVRDLQHGGIDDLAGEHRQGVLEHGDGAVGGFELDPERVVGSRAPPTSRWT